MPRRFPQGQRRTPPLTTDEVLARAIRALETNNGQRAAIIGFSLLATVVLLAFPGTWAALALGIPYIFFVPGFAVVRLFFWKDTSLEARFVLSLGLSILVAIFLGLILVLSPIGLDADTTRASLILFTLAAVAAEVFWRPATASAKPEIPEAEPFKVDKVVAAMLGTALVVSAISLGLIVTAEYPSRTYFAMTDEYGSADINTTRLVNHTLTLVVEMHNGEDGPRTFSLNAYGWNTTVYGSQWLNVTLAEGETVNHTFVFDLPQTGVWRVDFDLYISGEGVPMYHYGNLHLWFSVEE